MRENDYQELDTTIKQFEETVSALSMIRDISKETKTTSVNMDQLRLKIEAVAQRLADRTADLSDSINENNDKLKQSLISLDSAKAGIEDSGKDAVVKMQDNLRKVATELKSLNEEKTQAVKSEIQSSSNSIYEKFKSTKDNIAECIENEAKIIRQNSASNNEKTISRVEEETETVLRRIDDVDHTFINKIDCLERSTENVRTKLESLAAQNESNRKLIIAAIIISCASLIASVIGMVI